MKRKRMKQKLLSMLLCVVMTAIMFSGCGGKDAAGNVTDAEGMERKEEAQEVQSLSQESEEALPTTYVPLDSGARGRYVEETLVNLKEEMAYPGFMKQTGEGIWVFGETEARFRKKGSDSFDTVAYPEIIRNTYITGATANDNGDMVFACFEQNEEGDYEYILRAVMTDGTVIEMERGTNIIGDMVFGPDGRLYVHKYGSVIGIFRHELAEGEGEKVCLASSVADNMTFVGNRLLVLDEGMVWIYNIETDTQEDSDQVLDAFCKENITGLGAYSGVYAACIFPSYEEDVLYLACSEGIFRHVLYGSVIEQVVNGKLSSLSNPAKMLQGAAALQEENGNVAFLLDFYSGELTNYTYNADIPTVPEKMLHIYSLEDNADLRQIISLFQQTYPECYVKYEVGLSGIGSANVEDKIKKLNTAMLSGSGPDILITDGLNESNYSSKGLFTDLTSLAEGMTGEDALIPNFVEALKQDGKIYSIPAAFYIPMIAGEESFIKDVKDLESLTAAVEESRKDNQARIILTSTLPECILTVLAQTESGKWQKDGVLDEEALKEFLNCAYRMYEAETQGAVEGLAEREQENLDAAVSYISSRLITRIQNIYYNFNSSTADVVLKDKKAAVGYVGRPFDLCWVDQLPEGYGFVPLEDEGGVGFKPVMKFAINVLSDEQEMAQKFVKLALSAKTADLSLIYGMPLNVSAAEGKMVDKDNLSYHMVGTNNYGEEVEACATWPIGKTLEQYRDAIGRINHVIKEDSYLTEQVVEIGAKAMQEGKTVEEAVQQIKKKTALYLSE